MDYIWAPWRITYLEQVKPAGCILCTKPQEDNDAANYILYRGKHNFVIMNLYPYNPGHLMVAPYRHVNSLEKLTDAELHDHYEMVRRCLTVLREAYSPGGFNVGMNLGQVAGAGIADHIHTHIVPRWSGDTSFMSVLDDVRVIPQALADTYQKLQAFFQKA